MLLSNQESNKLRLTNFVALKRYLIFKLTWRSVVIILNFPHPSVHYNVARKVKKITSEFTLFTFFYYKNTKIQNGTVRPYIQPSPAILISTRGVGSTKQFYKKTIEQFHEKEPPKTSNECTKFTKKNIKIHS